MNLHGIEIQRDALAQLCEKHHIKRLSLFGSVLREDFSTDSDIDVLVEFHIDRTPGLLTFSGIGFELEDLLGRRVDLRTPKDLSRHFREEVLATAETLCVQEG